MEVVVVGGGIVGCASAAFLAAAGARVTLVEATALGAGASGRNSGAIQHPFDPVLLRLHLDSLDEYRALDGFALPDAPAGILLLTDDLDAARERALDLGGEYPELAPQALDEAELAAAEPLLAPGLVAVRLATGYPVPPEAAVAAYAESARQAGAELRLETAVAAVDGHGVTLADGTRLAADAVLAAAGPWTPELLDPDGGWRPIVRTWGVTVQVDLPRPAAHVLEEGVVHTINRVVDDPDADAEEVDSLFSMVSVGGTSTVGSTFVATEPDAARLAPVLVARGAAFVPSLARAPIVRHRVCARPQSLDGRPLVGRLPVPGTLVVAAGHGPWGISTGPATARLAAAAVLDPEAATPPEVAADRFGAPAV